MYGITNMCFVYNRAFAFIDFASVFGANGRSRGNGCGFVFCGDMFRIFKVGKNGCDNF
jgi:hypothetical protein